VETTSPEGQMIKSKKFSPNDQGMLVSNEQLREEKEQAETQRRANMTAADVADWLLERTDIEPRDKEAWEDEGLTKKLLETLRTSKLDLWRVYDNEDGFALFQIGMLYETFGFPIAGLPGTTSAQRPPGTRQVHRR
jgi:hypothetical protein